MILNAENFDQTLMQSHEPVLVDFWAEWCAPCKVMGPTIDELADTYNGRAKVAKIDVDDNADLATRFNIRAIPTMILFVDGHEVDRLTGITPKAALAESIDRHLKVTT